MPRLPCASFKLGAECDGFQSALGTPATIPIVPAHGGIAVNNSSCFVLNAPLRLSNLCAAFLALPSFCAGAAERGADAVARNVQCVPRPYSFVVHGLWPQYDNGFPEYCQIPAPRLDRGVVSSMLDLMPAPRLIFNEWDRHGTCSGQLPRAYFENGE